jgi:poly(hydroxyalkanoate) depolymerase family esterase
MLYVTPEERENAMPGLGTTIAALARQRSESGSGDGHLKIVDGFGANPGQLTMKVHAPGHREPRAALVVVLHGCTQTAEDYVAPVGWLDLADRFGFVVLAPEQRRANNANLCFNWYEPGDARRGSGEAASIAQMVAHAVQAYGVDEGRVFVTGLSAGGAMTSVMLATYPEIFAGGAVVAGLPYGVAATLPEALEAMATTSVASETELGSRVRAATRRTGPWPTVTVWHGQSDGIVRPAAGEAVAAQWRDVHGVKEAARTARTPDGRDFLVWLSPEGAPVVELHRMVGLGHGAAVKAGGATGCGHASRYTPEVGVSSTFEIASGWGLVQRDAKPSRPRTGRVDGSNEPAQPAPTPDDPVGSITQVINDALRAAGLVR